MLVTATLWLVGCGGGSSSTTPTRSGSTSSSVTSSSAPGTSARPLPGAPRKPLSQPEKKFIAAADAICRRLRAALVPVTPKGLELKELARLVPHGAQLERASLVELSRLAPPSAIARDWQRIIAYRGELADALAKVGKSAQNGNMPGVAVAFNSKQGPHRGLSETATRDGFKYCGAAG